MPCKFKENKAKLKMLFNVTNTINNFVLKQTKEILK